MEPQAAGAVDISAAELGRLHERSDAMGLARLTAHVGLLMAAGTATYLAMPRWWAIVTMAAQGLAQVSLFAAPHETVHRTAFKSRWLNQVVAELVGFVVVFQASVYRRSHLAHHRFTQDPMRDPELARPKPTTIGEYLRYASGWLYWTDRARELIRHAAGRVEARFIPPEERARVASEARCYLLGYAAIAALGVLVDWRLPVLFWLGPAVLAQPFLRLYLLAEHTGCSTSGASADNTRTTLTNPLVRFVMWNMPYHTEHHCHPAVPFHALPRLHRRLAPTLRQVSSGYGAFHRRYLGALRGGTGRAFTLPT